MSRETLLDEAIIKAKECEDWQLVEWLRMARGGESAARWYSDKLREAHRTERKLLDENAKMRELVADMWGFIEGTDEDCGDVTFSSCFDYCKHDTADDGCSKTGDCWYEQRMRELGVEVDDGAR